MKAIKNLLRHLKQTDEEIALNISNSIWIREGESIEEQFIATNREVFDAFVTQLDFSWEDAADQINKWISDATNKKIEKMIEPPISPNVVMYLINAIYFKGDWTHQFDKNNTFESPFHAGSGITQQAMMMSMNGTVEFGQGDGFKAVRLPYGNEKMAMYCILPDENTNINDFIADLDKEHWITIKDSISQQEGVQLRLLRFKLEYGIKNLNDSLKALGMGEAFSAPPTLPTDAPTCAWPTKTVNSARQSWKPSSWTKTRTPCAGTTARWTNPGPIWKSKR